MIYLTSDLHFNHDREFIYVPRGYKSIDEMNNAIVNNWNSTINDDDDVYVLGDLMLGGTDNSNSMALLKSLKGRIHIIRGNHDTDNRIALYKTLDNVVEVCDAKYLRHGLYNIFLCHFPTITGSLECESLQRTTICLCGHTHSKKKFYNDIPYIYNVACDAHDCTPVLIENVLTDCVMKVEECKKFL